MDEEAAELEANLLLACSSNQEEIDAATEYIQQAILDVDVIDDFKEIIQKSENPIAIVQASTQLIRVLRELYWKGFDFKRKTKFGTFFLDILSSPNEVQSNEMCIRSFISGLTFVFQKLKRTWPKLVEYVSLIESDFSPLRMRILSRSIHLFKDEEVQATFAVFLGAVTAGLSQGEDWELILDSLQVLIRLIEINPDELGGAIDDIVSLLSSVISTPEQVQLRFFSCISQLFTAGLTTESLVEAILEVGQSDEIFPIVGIAAINTLGAVIADFDEEQVDTILSIALQQGARLAESESVLPKDNLTFVAKVIKAFPKEAVYTSVKQKIEAAFSEESQPLLVAGILMIIPIIQNAPEFISGEEVNFCSSIIKKGLESDDSLAIQAVCHVIQELSTIDSMVSFLPQYIPAFIQHAQNVEDSELSLESLRALNEIVKMQQTLSEDILKQIWQLYSTIPSDKQEMFLDIMYTCISKTDKIDSVIISQIFEYISPVLENPELDTNLSSTCLLVCGAIIGKDETQKEKLESTAQITLTILEKGDDQPTRNALKFLGNICDALGEEAAPFIGQFAEGIDGLLTNEREKNHEVWVSALEAACFAIRYAGVMDLLEHVSAILSEELKEKEESTLIDALLDIKIIAKFLDAEKAGEIFSQILEISGETDSENLLCISLQALAKVVNSNKEENGEAYLEHGFQLCNDFISGELPALQGKVFTDLETDFNVDLLHAFASFAKRISGLSTEAADAICTAFLEVAERPFEVYRMTLTEVFIGAVENETVSQDAVQSYLGVVQQLIENSTPNESQQEIVYVLNLMLRKFPDVLPIIQTLLPSIIEWWKFARENRSVFEYLASNIASLFLNIAMHDTSFSSQLMFEALEFYPPADATECVPMSQCIIEILGRGGEVPVQFQVLASKGIVLLLTKPQSVIRRMKLDEEMTGVLIGVLKQLVSVESNLHAAFSAVEGSEAMTSKLQSILQ